MAGTIPTAIQQLVLPLSSGMRCITEDRLFLIIPNRRRSKRSWFCWMVDVINWFRAWISCNLQRGTLLGCLLNEQDLDEICAPDKAIRMNQLHCNSTHQSLCVASFWTISFRFDRSMLRRRMVLPLGVVRRIGNTEDTHFLNALLLFFWIWKEPSMSIRTTVMIHHHKIF